MPRAGVTLSGTRRAAAPTTGARSAAWAAVLEDARSMLGGLYVKSLTTRASGHQCPPHKPTPVTGHPSIHVDSFSIKLSTMDGMGEEDTKIALEGGIAQGANSSPALYISATAPGEQIGRCL